MGKAAIVGPGDLRALVAERTDISSSIVKKVLDGLAEEVADCLAEGYGVNIHGIVKIEPVYKAPKPKRKGTNPFTGEPATFAAKPASIGVKAKPMAKAKSAFPKTLKGAAGKKLIEALT